jgi:hypothetical protein
MHQQAVHRSIGLLRQEPGVDCVVRLDRCGHMGDHPVRHPLIFAVARGDATATRATSQPLSRPKSIRIADQSSPHSGPMSRSGRSPFTRARPAAARDQPSRNHPITARAAGMSPRRRQNRPEIASAPSASRTCAATRSMTVLISAGRESAARTAPMVHPSKLTPKPDQPGSHRSTAGMTTRGDVDRSGLRRSRGAR